MWIVRLALRRPYTFVALSLLVLLLGIGTSIEAPKYIYPYINIPVVTIVWSYSGLPPEDMEGRIVTICRDALQLRQAQGRTAKLENDVRQQIENATIAVESAHQAYAAAVESRNYQQQLLQAEIDKFAVGASTNFMIVQDQAYLTQARSTEVAVRSDWMKATLSLDRALGNLLEKNGILFEDAIREQAK